jgi:hypothetical protein
LFCIRFTSHAELGCLSCNQLFDVECARAVCTQFFLCSVAEWSGYALYDEADHALLV